MISLIIFGAVLWLVIAFIALGIAADEIEFREGVMIFFWPVTLPIFLVTGTLFAIWSAFVYSYHMFRGK